MPGMEVKYISKIVVDFVLLSIVTGCIFVVKKVWPPFQRGMFCGDKSISYPYVDDSDEKVSDGALLLIGVVMPMGLICVLEWFRVRRETVGKKVVMCGRDLNSWFWAAYSAIGPFLFGCATSQLTTDIAKYSVGRLRPHFIAICKPDWSKINCSEPFLYVDPIPCTSDDDHRMKEARLSFPSGHASFSAYTMIYFVIYLQVRFKFKTPKLVRPFLQFVCLMMTFYTTVSRISDYKHHWSDVLFGFSEGALVAVLVSLYVSDLFCDGSQPRSRARRHQHEGVEAVALQNCSQSSSRSKLDFV
ncbi:phospholipid phosphatase 1-like isoform X1 [Penaeus chinensis]|uniref:phospholipid phosphatase 1-like isoform X1 n=1 Tax=Penaeus chinensis TaxID=139456 RepID=UPI001FB81D30|nr:phospholipid phosphatase 1-like isoform X1 [Penaeus chinensis]